MSLCFGACFGYVRGVFEGNSCTVGCKAQKCSCSEKAFEFITAPSEALEMKIDLYDLQQLFDMITA
jgi:hypothetical protein